MAGSAGWARITYREQALPLEQRTGFVLDTCSRSQAFVVALRICKVTETSHPEPQGRGFVVPGKALSKWRVGF